MNYDYKYRIMMTIISFNKSITFKTIIMIYQILRTQTVQIYERQLFEKVLILNSGDKIL